MDRGGLTDLLFRRVLKLDGDLAVFLFSEEVPGAGFRPEALLLDAFDGVAAIHSRHARAGADVLLANIFEGNRTRLRAAGLAFAPRCVRAGARHAGGCRGTTPAHISALRRALR
jgi:methionine synthase I (cobalamin-dependent)